MEAASAVKIPIIGMGGITNGREALEFMLCGATAVAVGTANFIDPMAAARVVDEIEGYLKDKGIADVRELIGKLEVTR